MGRCMLHPPLAIMTMAANAISPDAICVADLGILLTLLSMDIF